MMQLIGGPPRPQPPYCALSSVVPGGTVPARAAEPVAAGPLGANVDLDVGTGDATVATPTWRLPNISAAVTTVRTIAAATTPHRAGSAMRDAGSTSRNGPGQSRSCRVPGRAPRTASRTASGNGVTPS